MALFKLSQNDTLLLVETLTFLDTFGCPYGREEVFEAYDFYLRQNEPEQRAQALQAFSDILHLLRTQANIVADDAQSERVCERAVAIESRLGLLLTRLTLKIHQHTAMGVVTAVGRTFFHRN